MGQPGPTNNLTQPRNFNPTEPCSQGDAGPCIETYIDSDRVHQAVDLDHRLRGVHLAEEVVQQGLGADNLAALVPLHAPEDLGEVLVGHEETTEKEQIKS